MEDNIISHGRIIHALARISNQANYQFRAIRISQKVKYKIKGKTYSYRFRYFLSELVHRVEFDINKIRLYHQAGLVRNWRGKSGKLGQVGKMEISGIFEYLDRNRRPSIEI